MNKRKNFKPDMGRIFAGIISFGLVIALAVGVISVVNNNNAENGQKKNYIDLNDINTEANNGTKETQKAVEKETETVKQNLADTERTTDKDRNVADASDLSSGGKDAEFESLVSENENEKAPGEKEQEHVSEADRADNEVETEPTGVPDETDNVADASDNSESAAEQTAGELAQGEMGADEFEDIQVMEQVSEEAAPVTASTATILGYTFAEGETLMRPVSGDVILDYNMDNTIFFPTLGVYRCNPAVVISAEEGSIVAAATDGIVMSVYEDEETGLSMQIAIGNDYIITYGQLKDILVGVGTRVSRGDTIGYVAAPTKYYSVEGSNLYFKLENIDGTLDPTDYFEIYE